MAFIPEVYAGVPAGQLDTELLDPSDFDDSKVVELTQQVLWDSPELMAMSEDVQQQVVQAVRKGVVLGLSEERDLPELDEFAVDDLVESTLETVEIFPDSPTVTHHDVRRAARTAINLTCDALSDSQTTEITIIQGEN